MAKLPCPPQSRIYTLKDTGETMSYDQVREYLMSNPELWSGKAEVKAGPLSSVEATAKALEGVDTSKIINPLSEKQFDKKYIAQHKDLQGKKEGTWRSNKTQILKNGLKEGVNVNALPIYTGSERNVIDKQYGNREGDIVYILPKEGVSEGRNGYKTKEGYIPKLSEIIIVEYDKQPTYEAYKNQLKSESYISSAYHAAKKDGSNPELVKAVEDLLGEKTEGKQAASNTPEGIAARIRNKKQRGALSAIDFGISVTVYNGALEFMAAQVEKGTKLGNAIANTIKWIDDKMKGEKWNKGAFGKYMNDTYKVTLGDGREVEVVRDDSKETAEVINGWYQPIEQKVLNSKEESLPANKWAERLKSKEDEDLWTGVRAFLEEKGTERVSRKELLDFIKDNRIEIVTVVKQKKDLSPDRFDIDFRNGEFVVTRNGVDEKVFQSDAKANDYIAQQEIKDESKTTKFSQYQLPGDKENYKEVLVTLPTKRERATVVEIDGKWRIKHTDGSLSFAKYISKAWAEKGLAEYIKTEKEGYRTDKDTFRSSHFDEPNILVHLRMNTRTDADGNKVLFLEEVQSDWGQKGKKEGFKIDSKEREFLIDAQVKINERFDRGEISKEDAIKLLADNEKKLSAIDKAIGDSLIPTAPFVMDTNAWVKLGLKTALQEAVRQGADKIAWTTGEQQNERYDLSKQVDEIQYSDNGDGTYNYSAIKNGKEIGSTENADLKTVESELGKDVAERMFNSLGEDVESDVEGVKSLTGKNLSVGGKGMKGFYGSAQEGSKGIIGGVAESLFGQKVGKVSIPEGKGILGKPTVEELTKAKELAAKAKDADAVKFLQEQIDRIKNGQEENYGLYNSNVSASKFFDEVRQPSVYTQSSISITPELKAQVEKGLPLFGTQLTPEQKLKQAFDEWKAENNKLGITINWEKLVESDKKFIKALYEYIKEKLSEGAYSFEEFAKEYGKKIVNFEEQKSKWQALYDRAAKEAKQKPPVTPPSAEEKKEEGGKSVRELPEAPEGQVVRAVLGRFFQAAKSEKVANAILESGLFRTPGKIEEAFANGRKLVDELGWDGAYELFQNLSTETETGIVLPEDSRMGIFNALTEDLQKRIDNPVSKEQQNNDVILMAEVMSKGSELVSGGAKRMRIFQEILRKNTVPYQYERRIKEWKALFPDSEITKELEERLKAAEKKYNEINNKFIELSEKQKQWEESQAVSDIKEDIESEKKAGKKAPSSVLKKLAERVRKLGVSRPGMFSAATPASLAWDAAVEAVAVTLDAGGSIEIAIKKGIQAIKDSKWYKGLSEKNKKKAEAEFVNHYADISEEGGGMVEVVKGKIVIPHSLIRYYVSEGMTDINEIADTILEGLSEKYPDLTQREVRDAITGYARKVKKQTPDEINDAINALKREGRLRSQLEDLQKGIVKEKNPKAKEVLSDRIKNLKNEIDRIHQEMFGHTTRQMSDAERLDAYKKRAAERIKELKEKIANRDFSKKPKRPPFDFDEEANNLEAEKYQLDEEWADLVAEEQARQASLRTKIGKMLLTAWGIPRTVVVGIDFGVFAIQAGLSMFNDRKQTAKAFANAFKAIRSTENYGKVDAILKSHPKYRNAVEAGLKFYSPKDPEAFKGDMVSISVLQRAWNGIGEAFTKPIGLIYGKQKEKEFYNYWKAINPLAALERSQAALVNTLNFALYLRGAEIAEGRGYTYKTNPKAYEQIADVANTLSRKASLGGMEKNKTFMNVMNAGFFSAQNWASLIKIASPYTFFYLAKKREGADNWYQLSPAQQVYGEIFVKAVAANLSTLLLIKLLTGWQDDDMDDEERKKKGAITVNMTDPRRADYLKVRLPEQTIDPFAGLAQEVILTYRIYQHLLGNRGFVSTKTGIESYLGEGNAPSPLGLIGRQVEGKLSPSARFAYRNTFLGSEPVKGQPSNIRRMYLTGEEINVADEFLDLYTNLTYQTAKDEFADYNVLPAAFLSLIGALGYGITREERMDEKSIAKQIRETTKKGKEYKTYERAFKNYAKDGDEELAKKVFEKTLGEKSKEAKSIEMIKEISEDGITDRYKLGLVAIEDMPRFFEFLKTGVPIKTARLSTKQAARLEKINELPKEQLDRLKSDYKVQYDEVMSAIKVLNSLGVKTQKGSPINYELKIKDIPWVKAYRKTILKAK